MSLSKFTLSDQTYESKGSQSVVLSLIPFDYASFSNSIAVGNSQILFSELSVNSIECFNDCSILSSSTYAINLQHSSFTNIVFQEDGSLISVSISQQLSMTFLNTTVFLVDGSHTKSLFTFQLFGSSQASITIGGLQVANSILNETLFYITGPQLTFVVDTFGIAGLSYEQVNPTTQEGLFHLDTLVSFVMQNAFIQVQTRS